MKIEDCKGCASERYATDHVKYTVCGMSDVRKEIELFDKAPTCPCSICLIKAMCKKECITFIRYIGKYTKDHLLSMADLKENHKQRL